MPELGGLGLERRQQLGIAVPQGIDADARAEIHVLVVIQVPDPRSQAVIENQLAGLIIRDVVGPAPTGSVRC